jgi:murein L,D-transpeptidase YafK
VKKTKLAVLPLAALLVLTAQDLGATVHWLPASTTADKVLVLKHRRRLYLIKGNHVLKTYRVSLGIRPVGPKLREGDHRTPEGAYLLDWHNTESEFYKSIHISYPNQKDLARAKRLGVPPGGDLFIHGQPNGFDGPGREPGDWTDGCISVSDEEMEEIFRVVADGTPILIEP